jgi:hypothetical protein
MQVEVGVALDRLEWKRAGQAKAERRRDGRRAG